MRGASGRLIGRWRVALRYGRRDARRARGRTALVATMIALTVGAGVFLSTVIYATADTPESKVAQQLGPELQASVTASGEPVLQDIDGRAAPAAGGQNSSAAEAPTTEVFAADARALLPDGSDLLPTTRVAVRLQPGDQTRYAELLQSDLTAPEVAAALPLVSGTLPDDGEVGLSAHVAAELGLAVDDTLDVGGASADGSTTGTTTVTVSGLIGPTPFAYGDVVAPADSLLPTPESTGSDGPIVPHVAWLVAGDAPVTWDDVLALNEIGAVVTSRAVLLDPPPADAVPYRTAYAEDLASERSDLVRSWSVVGAVVAVALLEAVLLIGPAFAVGTRRSARSLALIAAAGGTRRTVRAVVLGTGVVLGLGGSLLGALLGLAVVAVLATTTTGSLAGVFVPWWAVVAMVAIGTLIATAAAWIPARGASRQDVVAVLAGRHGERSARRWPAVVGAVVAVVGFGGALVAGITAMPLVVAVGVVVGELGLVLACGGIVALLGRVAHSLPLVWRFALRDAARHRGRTAPALAAVVVAVAGAMAGLVYSEADSAYAERSQMVSAAPGALTVAADEYLKGAPLSDTEVDQVAALMRDVLGPEATIHEVPVARSADPDIDLDVWVERPDDESRGSAWGMGAIGGPVVDDGSLADVLGLPDPDVARQALADGRAVVQAGTVWADGAAHLRVSQFDVDAEEDLGEEIVEVPAVGIGDPLGPSNANYPVLPPSLVEDLGGTTAVGGLAAMPDGPLTRTDRDTLQAELDEAFPPSDVYSCVVCAGVADGIVNFGAPQWQTSLLILGTAGLLALAAVWIAAALAAVEARPDLATLAAVGAAPRLRKRIVAAQAGTIAAIGSVLGATSGVALGAAFVLLRRYGAGATDGRWTVEVPWAELGAIVTGLPLIAVAVAWAVTRARVEIRRRIAS